MIILQRFLQEYTAQAMKKEGVKGTFKYTFKIEFHEDKYFAIGKTLINGLTGMISFQITECLMNNSYDVGDEFTLEVTIEE